MWALVGRQLVKYNYHNEPLLDASPGAFCIGANVARLLCSYFAVLSVTP